MMQNKAIHFMLFSPPYYNTLPALLPTPISPASIPALSTPSFLLLSTASR
uniref:Uncharacterized protein n=2 Tax=Picea TaxID=3328 RepID=A0A101LTU7_PICGL|nr:hypothetical protein ABT39_MTgene3563 [Picea glauca]QHR89847.1 hypothetical protein Q903MT_gene3869 [Picea sitchensis]